MNVSALYLVICEWLSQILVAMEPVFFCSTVNPSVGLLQAHGSMLDGLPWKEEAL